MCSKTEEKQNKCCCFGILTVVVLVLGLFIGFVILMVKVFGNSGDNETNIHVNPLIPVSPVNTGNPVNQPAATGTTLVK